VAFGLMGRLHRLFNFGRSRSSGGRLHVVVQLSFGKMDRLEG
jgi:hypothetical protein